MYTHIYGGFPGGSDHKESARNAGVVGRPLEKGKATHSRISCLEKRGWSSLAGYSPWSQKESDMTERLSLQFHIYMCMHIYIYIYTYIHIDR